MILKAIQSNVTSRPRATRDRLEICPGGRGKPNKTPTFLSLDRDHGCEHLAASNRLQRGKVCPHGRA